MLDSIKEGGIGFMILACGSPFYFFLIVDIFGNSLAQLTEQTYQPYWQIWVTIVISISFVIGFVMFFTKNDDNQITSEINGCGDLK